MHRTTMTLDPNINNYTGPYMTLVAELPVEVCVDLGFGFRVNFPGGAVIYTYTYIHICRGCLFPSLDIKVIYLRPRNHGPTT